MDRRWIPILALGVALVAGWNLVAYIAAMAVLLALLVLQ